jgi:hypothetical protein
MLGVAVALLASTTALAGEFIVVSSNDPAVRKGDSFDPGARLPLGPGRSATLMKLSGEVITLQGGAAGAGVPGVSGEAANNARYAAVKALFAPPPSGRAYGAQRGFCPGPEALDNLDAIVRSNQSGCKADARKALQEYLKAHGVSEADADQLYADGISEH